tara:strand:+ start:335 stop:1462 length:1128 start_codon:yes stop_codon:yes gene_type:complete
VRKLLLILFFPILCFGQGVAKYIVEDVVPLETNINQFKYIVFQEIYSNKSKDKSTLLNVLNDKLSSKSYLIIKSSNPDNYPEELKLNPNLALYLSARSERRGIFKFVSFVLRDFNGKIINQRQVDHDRSVKYLFGLVIQDFISMPHRFDPDVITRSKSRNLQPGEWAGNGSGIIISKSGYIVTNYHVIEDAEDIEVEFIIDGEVKKFNAKIVQSDKVNDLAIIKIFDMNFDGLDKLPYNFKTRSTDVGTKVYAYGYPMALSLMGKEIKITDGIISSKSGFDGDITTYQISAPIQAGNSGGPLFDDRGNFIGINSAGLRKEVADNVGYTIKSSYVLNLIDVLPKSIDLPSNTKLQSLPLTEQIKEISKYVVLVKVK